METAMALRLHALCSRRRSEEVVMADLLPAAWPTQYAEPMEQFRRNDLVFDVIDAGPNDGPVVVLLHGFPAHNVEWDSVIPRLTAQGYRCLAPDQRGYSSRARPKRRRDYRDSELVADVYALIEASGAERVHLVGHDAGAMVAWAFAAQHSDSVVSLSALAAPHPVAMQKAMMTSRLGLVSWYVFLFQLPRIPESIFSGSRGTVRHSRFMQGKGRSREGADRDAQAMADPAAFTSTINWYRAIPFAGRTGKVTVPTMYVWSHDDKFFLAKTAHNCGRYVTGEYRFEVLLGASHWILEERPDAVADLLLDWFAAHPVTSHSM
jgi:pimeloyl-ACP methyl ester carboxylesterase